MKRTFSLPYSVLGLLVLLLSLPSLLGWQQRPNARLLYVDGQSGSDTLAQRANPDKPYRTLTAAKTAAETGDLIIVEAATYNENNLAKNGVNWYFKPGARVIYRDSGRAAIFDTTENGTNAAASFTVDGQGYFEYAGNPPASGAVYASVLAVKNASTITFRCSEMKVSDPGTAQDHCGVAQYAGTVYLDADKISSYDYDGIAQYGGTLFARVRHLHGSYSGAAGTGEGIEVSGDAVCYLNADLVQSDSTTNGGDAAILITATGGGNPTLIANVGRIQGAVKGIRLVGNVGAAPTAISTINAGQVLGQVSAEVGDAEEGSEIPILHLTTSYISSATQIPVIICTAGPLNTGYKRLWIKDARIVSGGGNREAVQIQDLCRLILSNCALVAHGTATDDIKLASGATAATLQLHGTVGGVAGLQAGITAEFGSYTTDADFTYP